MTVRQSELDNFLNAVTKAGKSTTDYVAETGNPVLQELESKRERGYVTVTNAASGESRTYSPVQWWQAAALDVEAGRL